jgi:hypothetical protein
MTMRMLLLSVAAVAAVAFAPHAGTAPFADSDPNVALLLAPDFPQAPALADSDPIDPFSIEA